MNTGVNTLLLIIDTLDIVSSSIEMDDTQCFWSIKTEKYSPEEYY